MQTDNERRVVQLAEGVALEQLAPGDEVFLSHERNIVIAKSLSPSFLTGEVATYSRSTGDGRLVLRSHDEEVVVLCKAALRDAGLKAGDGVRFSRSAGLAFEKIEASKGEEFFLEATPSDTFHEIGGLDREIEATEAIDNPAPVSLRHDGQVQATAQKIRAHGRPAGQRKNEGGARYVQLACGVSRSGRSRFINVKPGGLNSMWYGATEQRYRRYLPHCPGSGSGGTGGAGCHVLG